VVQAVVAKTTNSATMRTLARRFMLPILPRSRGAVIRKFDIMLGWRID